MNMVFFSGYVVDEVNFKFILRGKYSSAAKFKIKLSDGTLLPVVAYDYTADYSYRKLKKGDVIFCEATISENSVVVGYIEKIAILPQM